MSERQFEDLLKETLEEYGEPGATPRDAMWRAVADSRRKVVELPWWRRPMTRVDFLAGAVAAALLLLVGILVGRMIQNPAEGPGLRSTPLIADSPVVQPPADESTGRARPGVGDRTPVGGAGIVRERRTPGRTRPRSAVNAPREANIASNQSPGLSNDGSLMPTGVDGQLDLGMRSSADEGNRDVLRLVATRYLSRTESFLTRWRAGDPASDSGEWTRDWARRGLTDVRLLLDTAGEDDPEMKSLLLDLEVVLAQILQASADGSAVDRDRATRRLNDRAVLPRLRNMIPAGPDAAVTQGVPR